MVTKKERETFFFTKVEAMQVNIEVIKNNTQVGKWRHAPVRMYREKDRY